MITLLFGENSFEVERELQRLAADFDGTAEKLDAESLGESSLADIFTGQSLFATQRLVVIKNLSDNKPVWTSLEKWVEQSDDSTHIVLVEPKPDKRTKTYKLLKQVANVREYTTWSERDNQKAGQWLAKEASSRSIHISPDAVREMVARVGVNQWKLLNELERLSVLGPVTVKTLQQHTEPSLQDTVFDLLTTALDGDARRVHDKIEALKLSNDPYMTFGLLASQLFSLAALVLGDKPSADIAKDIGAHPFVLSKLTSYSSRLDRVKLRQIVESFAATDSAMKSTSGDAWMQVESLLVSIAH